MASKAVMVIAYDMAEETDDAIQDLTEVAERADGEYVPASVLSLQRYGESGVEHAQCAHARWYWGRGVSPDGERDVVAALA